MDIQRRRIFHNPLDLVYVDHVVVHGMEVAGIRRRNPSGVAAGSGMVNLSLQHFRHGPVPHLHALTYLAVPMNPGLKAHVHIVKFIAGVVQRAGKVVP